ncbi:cytochrome P450 family protein [Pseudalkalibacillus decolorationis]|uniref:cytochrome P450 family protein n=1 Tax=Pseudalkalibacillus decolorationis TaxID=163879 RepID=UPI002148A0CB|nr:cytochrome P450 [Pseudalkalibacillus decolorationis]
MTNQLDFTVKPADLFTSEFKDNAHSLYEKLRKEDPVHRMVSPEGQVMWLITRYQDASEVLKDQRFIKDARKLMGGEENPISPPPELDNGLEMMLFADPPDHTRLRKLVQKAFTPKMINQLQGRVQQIADELLDEVQGNGEMDLIDDFAFPLPIIVISEMLGIPTEDRNKFREWSDILIDGASDAEEYQEVVLPATQAFIQYLHELLEKRRNNPEDDLISGLLLAEEEGDKLNEQELYGMIVLLIIAGHETTVNMIGNGVLALLENPHQFEKLKEDPALIHSAVEEMLRYYSPVEVSTDRWAGESFEWKGHSMSKGDWVIVSLASANRDEEQFAEPDLFDITREKNRHIAFGTGIHHCVGAPLARLEGVIAVRSLLQKMPNLKIKGNPDSLEWRSSFLIRGLKNLPVTF